ncbi:TRAP transporter small permease [Brucella pituitosa]|uniref:TRAP transporter small permease n=1 Tax=Brucella pituitosa TaxID=571256 RepID=UPI0020057EF8|nr:TRAP transporter small permease [Brucella pituitosa]MCK4207240.1 TRAP transporter small permease [Brucella pituitosa]
MSILQQISDLGFKALEAFLVLILATMVALVFANVVMRYGFDTGITITDEVSRMMFVWISFVGAVVVARRREHLGVDILTAKLTGGAAILCRVLTNIIIIVCCCFLVAGAYEQTITNMANNAPISGIPMGVVYAAPLIAGGMIGLIAFIDLLCALFAGTKPQNNEDHTK